MNVCRCGTRINSGFLCSFCSMEQVDWFKEGEEIELSAEEIIRLEQSKIEKAKKKQLKQKNTGRTDVKTN